MKSWWQVPCSWSVTYCFLSNESFAFLKKEYWFLMVTKNDDLMWKPCGPSLCSLFCPLELDYSVFFFCSENVYWGLSTAACAPVLGTVGWERSGMRYGFCPWEWTVYLERQLSSNVQPKWENDLSGIMVFGWSGLKCSQGRLRGGHGLCLIVDLE